MKKRGIVWLSIIILALGTTNICTVYYYQMVLEHQKEQMETAYQTIMSQESTIIRLNETKVKYDQLQLEYEKLLENKEQLEIEKEDINKNREKLKSQFDELNLLVEEYDYVFQYDPVELKECQVYINELEERLLAKGGYDKYDVPSRVKSYDLIDIYLEDGASEKWANQAMEYLRLLPEKMLIELKEAGWLFIITPRNLEHIYDSKVPNTVGLTIYYKERIYVLNDSFSIKYCTIHEVGHAMDFLNNFVSYDEEWLCIYDEESETSGLSQYFTNSSTEYFAESFQSYVLCPEELKTNAPKTYDYMDAFYQNYK